MQFYKAVKDDLYKHRYFILMQFIGFSMAEVVNDAPAQGVWQLVTPEQVWSTMFFILAWLMFSPFRNQGEPTELDNYIKDVNEDCERRQKASMLAATMSRYIKWESPIEAERAANKILLMLTLSDLKVTKVSH